MAWGTCLARAHGQDHGGARDMPGFIVNRILMPMINEAVVASEGIGNALSIDAAMKLGTWGQPMGHAALAKSRLGSPDTCLAIMEVLHLQGRETASIAPSAWGCVSYVGLEWPQGGRGFHDR